ncbi:MAG: alpha-L-fucosidase [Bifidobacterium sp.]|nr:alpha-L-fucosidase [Bifidobacterium sp.]
MAANLAEIERIANASPFTPDWDSLSANGTPDWFRDAKFGIFVHWGPYTVPEFHNEWYARNMYRQGSPEFDHHIAAFGARRGTTATRPSSSCSARPPSTRTPGAPSSSAPARAT